MAAEPHTPDVTGEMSQPSAEAPPKRPPILFLIVDCLRADRAFAHTRLAPDGYLANLSRRGFSFTNAVTVAPTTTPAVATMLTGLYPFEHGLRGLLGYARPADVRTIAGALREVGYWTEAEVAGPLVPQLRLFDEFDEYRWLHWREASLHGPRGETIATRIRELQQASQPWFFVVHLWDLHEPRRVPPGFREPALSRTVYDRALAALDARLRALLPDELLKDVLVCIVGDHGENLRLEPRGKPGKAIANLLWWPATRRLAQPVARRLIRRGAQSSSKRLLRLAPRALLTHGHHLLEPLLRVPFVLAGPGVPQGSSAALVSHTDLAPGLSGLAGTWFQGGVGAVGLNFDGGIEPDRRVYLETAWVTPIPGVRQVGVRTPRWKYMELADSGGAAALFDLAADPDERRNVVTNHPEVAEELREDLQAAFAAGRVGDPMSDESTAIVERRLADLGYVE
jgi:arylsulfatase A-like enzyme